MNSEHFWLLIANIYIASSMTADDSFGMISCWVIGTVCLVFSFTQGGNKED